MSNETYDKLKFAALLILPIGTLISTFCHTWGIPYAEQIMQTFVALDVFAGAVVTAAKSDYDREHGHE